MATQDSGNGPTEYVIDIMMSGPTVAKMKEAGFALYGFKAVKTANGGAAPVVWFQTLAQVLMQTTTVSWTEQYQAYVSTSQIIPNGVHHRQQLCRYRPRRNRRCRPVRQSHHRRAGHRFGDLVEQRGVGPWTSGISQLTGNGTPSPMVALPLYGNMLEVIVPIEKVLLMFASPTVNTGTVIYKSYSSGVLVDLTGAPGNPPTRTVIFDLNDGWSWGDQGWGTPVQAQADLIPFLISNS